MTFTGLVAALPLFLISFSYSFPSDVGDEGSTPALVLIYGLLTLVVVAWIQRRSLDRSSLVKLAAS